MSRIPKKNIESALQKMNQDWRGKNGVDRVHFQTDFDGNPVFIFSGAGSPKTNIPGGFVVSSENGQTVIPIKWHSTDRPLPAPANIPLFGPAVRPLQRETVTPPEAPEKAPIVELPIGPDDIDKAYWWFATDAPKRPIDAWYPAFHAPPVPSAGPIPDAPLKDNEMFFDANCPQYNCPNRWAKPIEPYGCLCCTWYQRPTIAYGYQVPDTYLMVIDGIAIDSSFPFAQGEAIFIEVLRNNDPILSFDDYCIDPANPDPSKRWAFTGAGRKLPLWALFNRSDVVTVRLTLKGIYPFNVKTENDSFCGTVCILLHGWLGSRMDNRDGASMPIDPGQMWDGSAADALLLDPDFREKAENVALWLKSRVG